MCQTMARLPAHLAVVVGIGLCIDQGDTGQMVTEPKTMR